MNEPHKSKEVSQQAVSNVKAGRDIKIGDIKQDIKQIFQNKPDFFEPKFKRFESGDFISPKQNIINELIQVVRTQRLLVLGGSDYLNKTTLAQYVAWKLKQAVKREPSSGSDDTPVKEWNHNSGFQSLNVAFQEEDNPTIFVLTQISPKDVNYNLSQIQVAATSRSHYVVVSTDTPFDTWKLPPSARDFWQDLTAEELYSSDALVELLIKELDKVKTSLPSEFIPKTLKPKQQIVGDLTLQTVAEQLKTPDDISRFVQLLCAEREIPSDERELEARVLKLIETAQDKTENIRRWYYTLLEPREQLLALGLSFFDGFFDDQFFAALEKVVTEVWQRRDTSLRALDYCDLDNLRNFFNFIETDDSGTKIESRLPDQRRMVFEVAWKSHRRQILAALPEVEKLIKDSALGRPLERELYGTQARQEQLRRSIGEAISDIGLIATDAVEDILLRLAADDKDSVQDVAAYAMARWLNHSQDEREQELFEKLQNWQSEARIISLVESYVEGRDEKNSKTPQDYLRATIVLTLGYVAQYYRPKQPSDESSGLPEKLCNLLKELSNDPNSLVRTRLGLLALPRIVPLHLAQLRPLLCYMTRYSDLIVPISASLALAYQVNPRLLLNVLDAWKNNQIDILLRIERPPHEHLLVTVAYTYGYIELNENLDSLSAGELFEKLQSLLENSKHPFVRRSVIDAIGIQLRKNFSKFEPYLQKIANQITKKERKQIIVILTNIYLDQRNKMKGGDLTTTINDRDYQVWLNAELRPQTEVEIAMNRWVKMKPNDTNALAQEIAEESLVRFVSTLDIKEQEYINKLQKSVEKETIYIKPTVGEIIKTRPQYGIYLDKIIPWIATRNAQQYKPYIRNLLPEASKLQKQYQEEMDWVLSKWESIRDENYRKDEEFNKISNLLKSGLWWAKYLGWFIGLGSGSLLILVYIIAANISDSIERRPTNIGDSPSNANPSPSQTQTPESAIPTNPRENETIYHSNLLPVGSHSFYERGLGKNVSYIRKGNEMVGAVYNLQQPNTITCFATTLSQNQANTEWWGNLEQVRLSGDTANRNYSIASFTADNINFRDGLDNPSAVEQCQNRQ
ncbi:MAG: hypothetical protein F6J86_30345 [Symploca sp. SIO1B1]|nr:hypothetical protein [Symploca sp. SIO1B1]